MNRRLLHAVALVYLALVISGCSSESSVAVVGSAEAEYRLCTDPAGSWTDLTDEDSGWRDSALHVPWADESGCAVRLDSVWHRFGDEHCALERVEFISFGLPMGTPYTGPDATPPGQDWEPMFFFNEGGEVERYQTGEVWSELDLPASALDTGLRTSNGARLLLADDDSALYVVSEGKAKVFIEPDDEIACA